VGGYLGAGKTTLLNHILRHSEGRRLAVIVNDFGSINIDVELIESQEGNAINLANGCVCCTLGADLAVTLMSLAESVYPPDHIIIEASGVADPVKIAQYGHTPGLRLDGIIVLADAEMVRRKARDKYVGETVVQQLRGADIIVLNKIDLVTDETRKAVRTWLRDLVPGARIVEAEHGVVPLPLLVGNAVERPLRFRKPQRSNHELAYDTWSYTADEPLDGAAFRVMVEALPEDVIRAKGILHLVEDPAHRTIFQLVGKRWSLKPGGEWGETPPRTQLVMIGLPGSIDEAWLAGMVRQISSDP